VRKKTRAEPFHTLRPYQVEAGRAVVDSVLRRKGLSFSIEIARQGGKNELSARIELLLLATHLHRDVTSVKAAPTFRPQALISLRRLWSHLQIAGLGRWAAREEGHAIRLGFARQVFLSAEPTSNVVGHTASLLLEIDEAQDVDVDKFDKELRPMASSTAATTVFYGTAWDDRNLLERAKQANLEAEARDGVRRHFEYDWQVVAAANPAYGRFVRSEEQRLGPDHPLFLTQYCLKPIRSGGRLLGPTQLSLLRGSHQRLAGPGAGEAYVAGLDIGGEGNTEGHDATVLTIGRVHPAEGTLAESEVEVVAMYAWSGAAHIDLHGAIVSLVGSTWRAGRLVVDATGLGEPVAAFLKRALPRVDVTPVKLSSKAKSRLGYDLLAAINRGRLRLFEADHSPEAVECWRQLERCRASYRADGSLNFYVDPRDGHDDYVVSLALLVAAASGGRRLARGRVTEDQT
jgi:hypothetical protein